MNHARQAYTEAFQAELARLNPGQRAAVDQIDGPVMVLAGPGTGKTHLLAARIGNILLQTDARANNILCLTYTEAGVRAMRQRLLQLIGPEAHRVNIFTFHGFCNLVIQDNLEYFGRPRLEPLSDLERIRIIRSMLDGLDVHHPLRLGRGNTYFYEGHLHWLFNTMKAEDWTVAEVLQQTDLFIDTLADDPEYQYQRNYKTFKKGDSKVASIQREQQRMNLLKAAVELFPLFQQKLREEGRYDFADMIKWVLDGFREHPILLRMYQERYLYLLVDEFQDTNGAQNEIVRLLSDFWDRPNVFIVGDDDQSIYEFQGARLQSMTDFFQRYAGVTLVTLTDNYRSSPPILKAATGLINRNDIRIQNVLEGERVSKTLKAANPAYAQEDTPIRLWEYSDRDQENAAVLAQLQQWHAAGIAYADMAVIYARHKQADQLQQLLEASAIPYVSKRPTNVLNDLPVRQLRELLTYFQREQKQAFSGEYLLYKLLHFRCFDLATLDLAKLSIARVKSREKGREATYWRDLLQDLPLEAEGLRSPEKLRQVGSWLEDCIGVLASMPLSRFVEKVLNGSGLLAWMTRRPDRARQLAAMTSFLDFIRAEIVRRPRLTLNGLLTTLQHMDDNRITLPLRNQLEHSDAVTLVTAHSAKGLEFECVWMLDCNDKEWNGTNSGGNRNKFSLPKTITLSGEADAIEAKRRLFFVGMTRARTELVISYARLNDKRKPQSPALFISELAVGEGSSQVEEKSLDAEELLTLVPLRLGAATGGEPPAVFETEAIAELLANYRLSISGFNRYLDCPLTFFYETVLRVPSFQREQAVYGDALHEALQDYFLRMRADPFKVFPGESELVYYFEQAMERRRARFEPKQYQDRLQQGRRELASYYRRYRQSWISDCRVEQKISNAEVKGVPLTGIIDRVDHLSDTTATIWDYKSGTHSQDRLRRPTEANPHGGSYWRQLLFYKLLFENRPSLPRTVTESGISFLVINQAGEQPLAKIDLNADDLHLVTSLIAETWDKIQQQQFQGCGKPACRWCSFVADNHSEIPMVEAEIEGLDDN
ncbi:MAG: ATP-dependent DNA helicase [Bacteroidota bacterium]